MTTAQIPLPTIPGHLKLLPLAWLEDDPDNERADLDQHAVGDLRDSIAEWGILEPLQVFELTTERYMLSAGHRRKAAAIYAGLTHVPCLVVPAPDQASEKHLRRLTLNLQRQDLTPIELAHSYDRILSSRSGLTQRGLAERLGISQSAVANTIRLLKLPAPVQEMIVDGHLTPGHGLALLRLESLPGGQSLTWDGLHSKSTLEEIADRAKAAADSCASVRYLDQMIASFMEDQTRIRERMASQERARQAQADLARPENQPKAPAEPAPLTPEQRAYQERQAEYNRQRELAQQRQAVAQAVIIEAVTWDRAKLPPLPHLQYAAICLADNLHWQEGKFDLSDRESLKKQITAATGLTELLNIVAALAMTTLEPSHTGTALACNQYQDTRSAKWADKHWALNKKLHAALAQAGLQEEPPISTNQP